MVETKGLDCGRLRPAKLKGSGRRLAVVLPENFMRPSKDAFQIPQTLSAELTALFPAGAQTPDTLRLITGLSALIPAEKLAAWLQTVNPGFDGRAPQELIEIGETNLIWEMIHQTRHGALA